MYTKKIFYYVQTFGGVGHFFRSYHIARELAEFSEVFFVDSGPRIELTDCSSNIHFVSIPRLDSKEGIVAVDPEKDIDETLQERKQTLSKLVSEIQPDAIICEFFPFSRWALRDEILTTIRVARGLKPHVSVFSSIRDIIGFKKYPASKGDCCLPESGHASGGVLSAEWVLDTLRNYFTAILFHAEKRFLPIEEQIPWIEKTSLPVFYTGWVCAHKKLDHSTARKANQAILVSNGGQQNLTLVEASLDAWRIIHDHPEAQQREMIVHLPLRLWEADGRRLCNRYPLPRLKILPFSSAFREHLGQAGLSISRAGYNTFTQVLKSRIPALFVPVESTDQLDRCKSFAKFSMCDFIVQEQLTPELLAEKILYKLGSEVPNPNVDLGGARRSAMIVQDYLDKASTAL